MRVARIGIIDWNLGAGVAHMSKAALEFFDLPLDQPRWPRDDIRDRIHPEDRARVEEYFYSEARTGVLGEHEFRIMLLDGSVRWVAAIGRLFRAPSGEFDRRLSVLMDITQRKHLEEQFRQAQKLEAMGRLAGGVAHDFNNLLTVIGAAAEFVAEAADADSELARDAAEIQSAVQRGQSLTRQLLTFSRRQVIRQRRIDLNAAVRDSESLLQRLMGASVTLEVECAPVALEVIGDPHQLEQVLMNLVVNARDAMPEGGHVSVVTRRVDVKEGGLDALPPSGAGAFAELTVSDTGVGMDDETRSHIFEPFFTTKDAAHGTGLGLATVFGIVSQANGVIGVDSAVGRGTTFRVLLPLVTEARASLTPAIASVAIETSGTETILLVEDEPHVRLLVRRILHDLGYKVLEASDGQEALEIAGSHRSTIHLLLCDVILPGHNGREIAEAMTVLRPDMPTLFISGHVGEASMQHELTALGATLLAKPFTRQSLGEAVRAVLTRA